MAGDFVFGLMEISVVLQLLNLQCKRCSATSTSL
jgi:hypothetical protein